MKKQYILIILIILINIQQVFSFNTVVNKVTSQNIKVFFYHKIPMPCPNDNDCDGILDDEDLDDDNDGILDTVEGYSTGITDRWKVSTEKASYTYSNGYVLKIEEVTTETIDFNSDVFMSENYWYKNLGGKNSLSAKINPNTEIEITLYDSNKNQPVTMENLIIHMDDIGNSSWYLDGSVTIALAGNNVNGDPLKWEKLSGNGNLDFTETTLQDNSGGDKAAGSFKILGKTNIVKLRFTNNDPTDYDKVKFIISGVQISAQDTDNDGIPDYQDTDSDNDGCPDAFEAGRSNLLAPPLNDDQSINGEVDSNGIPKQFKANDYGESRDASIQSKSCLDCFNSTADNDKDGIPDACDLDDDNDGILDEEEGTGDIDKDGKPNNIDLDSDGDGCLDAREAVFQNMPPIDANGVITASVDITGIPQNFKASDIGTSQEPNTSSDYCDKCLPTGKNFADLDGDGVGDYCDLDSDNDGILDADEGFSDSFTYQHSSQNIWEKVSSTSQKYQYSNSNIVVRVTTSNTLGEHIDNDVDFIAGGNSGANSPNYWKFQSSDYNTFKSLGVGLASSTVLIVKFENALDGTPVKVKNPIINLNYIDEAKLTLEDGLSWEQYEGNNVEVTSNEVSTISGTNGAVALQIKGSVSEIKITSDNEDSIRFIVSTAIVTSLDTDKDGTPDYLDLDSDNDGCPDALEANENITYAMINEEGKIMKPVDSEGVPIGFKAKGVGTSIDEFIMSDICTYCDVENPAYVDTDGDGVGDYCDLDDDNDGILDELESGICITLIPSNIKEQWTITDQVASYDYGNGLIMEIEVNSGASHFKNLKPEPFNDKLSSDTWYTELGGTYGAFLTGFCYPQNYTPNIISINFRDVDGNSVEVENPIIHFDKVGWAIDKYGGRQEVSAKIKLESSNMSFEKISGTEDFEVSNQYGTIYDKNQQEIFYDQIDKDVDFEESTDGEVGTASGSVRVIGKMSTIKLRISQLGEINNDRFVIIVSACPLNKIYTDTDQDGIPDYHDLDSDNDGCSDALEGGANNDTDKITLDHLTIASGSLSTQTVNLNFGTTVDEYGTPIVNGTTLSQTISASVLSETITIISPKDQELVCSIDEATFTSTAAFSEETKTFYHWEYSYDGTNWLDITMLSGGNISGLVSGTIATGGVVSLTLKDITSALDSTYFRVSYNHEYSLCNLQSSEIAILKLASKSKISSLTNNTDICWNSTAEFYIKGTPLAEVVYTLDGGVSTDILELNSSGTYTYTISEVAQSKTIELLSVSDGTCDLPLTLSSTVNVQNLPFADAGSTQTLTCIVTEVTLGGSLLSDVTYLWTTEDGHIVSGSTTANPLVDQSGLYKLLVTNSLGCVSSSTVMVNIDLLEGVVTPTFDLETTICPGYKIILSETSKEGITGTWSPDIDSYKTTTYIFTPELGQCASSVSVTIGVDPLWCDLEEDEELVIHNIITPNGDGVNDYLVIDGIDQYPNNTLKIANRWGNIVYEKEDYSNDTPWDCSSTGRATVDGGKRLPSGTYFYILTINKESGGALTKKGWIYIN